MKVLLVSLVLTLPLFELQNMHTRAAEAYSELCQTFMMECFVKIVDRFQPLTIYAKRSILDACQGPRYAYECREPNSTRLTKLILCCYTTLSVTIHDKDVIAKDIL